MKKKYDYLIVGSGLFGAVFAREMTNNGKKVLVIERRDHIGGNIYTERRYGIDVHKYGAHIFHTSNRKIWDYVNNFTPFRPFVNSPVANFNGELFALPFNMNTFYKLWGTATPEAAQAKIAEQKKAYADITPQNLEEQAIKLVGVDIYEKLIKGYTEKQWGKKCRDLPAFIIKRLPVRFTFDNNYFNDTYQGIPEAGYTELIAKLLTGAEVRTAADFFADRNAYENCAAKIVFTGRIDRFFDGRFGKLQYRSLRFEEETLPTENFQGVAVMNFTAADVPYTRIIEHKHFTKAVAAKTIVSREYPLSWQEGLEPFYPINDAANAAVYAKYEEAASERPDVIFGGRLGTYRYLDMDKVIEQALNAAADELRV